MPSPEETDLANRRLAEAAETRKAISPDALEAAKVEEEKKKSMLAMREQLREMNHQDSANRMGSLERVAAVVSSAARKTKEDVGTNVSETAKAQLESTKKIATATAFAAGAITVDASADVATGGITALPGAAQVKDMMTTEAIDKAWEAMYGEKMTHWVDKGIAYALDLVPGLGSLVNPVVIASLRISVTEQFKMNIRSVKLAAESLPKIVDNLKNANESLNAIVAEQKQDTARETKGNAQQVGAAA